MCNSVTVGVLGLARIFREEIAKLDDGIEWRIIHSRRVRYIYVYNNHGTGIIVTMDGIRYFDGLKYKHFNGGRVRAFVLETLKELQEQIPPNAKSFTLPEFKITGGVDLTALGKFYKFAYKDELKRLMLYLHASDDWYRCPCCQSVLHYTKLKSLIDYEYKCLSCNGYGMKNYREKELGIEDVQRKPSLSEI